MKEIAEIIQAYKAAQQAGKKTALATVVQVEGSAYRGAGARMLVTEDGTLAGAISGGCLEGDALRKACMVMQQGIPCLVTYDTTDEEGVLGIRLGCRGRIRVLIEPVGAHDARNPVSCFPLLLKKRSDAVLVTFFSPERCRDERQGTRICAQKQGGSTATEFLLGAGDLAEGWRHQICRSFELRRALYVSDDTGGERGPLEAFLDYIRPSISLVIAGAGNDVLPLVEMARLMGWETTVIDGRPRYADAARFASCSIVVGDPGSMLPPELTDDRTACLLMSHNYQYDKAMLRYLHGRPVPYIGALGPRQKFLRMLSELEQEGIFFSAEQRNGLYGPVGLDIGAGTPEQIACAITAEINMVFSGGSGRPLSALPGKIHDREKSPAMPA